MAVISRTTCTKKLYTSLKSSKLQHSETLSTRGVAHPTNPPRPFKRKSSSFIQRGVTILWGQPRPLSIEILKAGNQSFPLRYITFLNFEYFLRKLPKRVKIGVKKSRPYGYFLVGVQPIERFKQCYGVELLRFFGKMVSTLGCKSENLSSYLDRTYLFLKWLS